eukprot:g10359.t1
MVSKVLQCATEESTNHDLRDRGYIYWRLLATNPEATKRVVLGDKPSIRDDSQYIDKNLLERLSSELSLMSSVYHKYADEFVTRLTLTGAGEDKAAAEDDLDEEDRQASRRAAQEELERGPGVRNGADVGGGLDLLDLGGVGDDSPSRASASAQKALVCPDILPGSSADVCVPMAAGQLPSNTPPASPLLLQVAIKTSLDIFYFHVQFDLSTVLLEDAALSRDEFTPIWQRVGEGGQKVTMINLDRPLDAETLKGRLQAENICYVAQRQQLGVERLCCPRIRRLDPRVAKDRLVDSAKALASCY